MASESLINDTLEKELLACMMFDATLPGRMLALYRGIAEEPARLWGVPIHQQIASVVFSETRPGKKILPSLIAAKVPNLNGFDPQRIYDSASFSLNARWEEIASHLRKLAIQREIVSELHRNNWRTPIPEIVEVASDLERVIQTARSSVLPYDPGAEARLREFEEMIANSKMGRIVATGIQGWDSEENGLGVGVRIDPGEATVIHGLPKCGKAQPLTSKVRTSRGLKAMGDLKVGDDLASVDGKPSQVVGIYPQGKQQVYKITFADGRAVRCTGDHLWRVYYRNRKERWRIITTSEIRGRLNELVSDSAKRIAIELPAGEWGETQTLPIDPYVLGAFIGNGYLSGGTPKMSTGDTELLQLICDLAPGYEFHYQGKYDYNFVRSRRSSLPNDYTEAFKQLGLHGKHSYEKFIPAIYLEGSRSQRLALLQGLMDTDSESASKSRCYTTTSLQLAQDVQRLVWSLGGVCKIAKRFTHFTYRGEKKVGRESYRCHIRYDNPRELFRTKKKRDHVLERAKPPLRLCIVSVEPDGEDNCQCIEVSHASGLYITDNDVVTHNTSIIINLVIGLLRKAVGVTHLSAEKGYSISDLVAQYLCVLTAEHHKRLYPRLDYPRMSHDRLIHGRKSWSNEELTAYQSASQEFARLPLFLYARPTDQGGCGDLATALGWARLDREVHSVSVVVLDNVQSYRDEGENDYELVNKVLPPATDLQSEYGLYLFLISQQNAQGQIRGGSADLPGIVNNVMNVTAVGTDNGIDTVRVAVDTARFRSSGQARQFRIHSSSRLVLPG